VYGPPGIGKTTFAAGAPNSVFIRTEDGLGNLEANSFDVAKSFADVMAQIKTLATEAHNFQWLIIDSLSALEPMIWDQVAKAAEKKSIEDFGFGKGYVLATDVWRQLFDALALLNQKGIGVILICHAAVVRYESPEVDGYDRSQLKLHKAAFGLVYERADIIGYASKEVFVRVEKNGEKRRGLGVDSGSEHSLSLVERASFIAKNRYQLPEKIPLSWLAFYNLLMQAVAPRVVQTAAQTEASNPTESK